MNDVFQAALDILPRIVADLEGHHPRTIVLFGSMARLQAGIDTTHRPQDIDLLVVGDQIPINFETKAYGFPTEITRMRTYVFVEIARSLRYDSRPVALSKLYGNQLIKQQAHRVIAASLLLGPDYRSFGIEQIEVDGLEDPRDYSVHQVLLGRAWWRQIVEFARERRGPLKRFSDKIVQRDVFVAD
jgi:predicted nucleotidyltransferase